jgi:hypothetical protein
VRATARTVMPVGGGASAQNADARGRPVDARQRALTPPQESQAAETRTGIADRSRQSLPASDAASTLWPRFIERRLDPTLGHGGHSRAGTVSRVDDDMSAQGAGHLETPLDGDSLRRRAGESPPVRGMRHSRNTTASSE